MSIDKNNPANLKYFKYTSPCPYFEERVSESIVVYADAYSSSFIYATLLDYGYRRSGELFYKNDCPSCDECIPMRIEIDKFTFNKRERRILNKNRDLRITVSAKPTVTDEKLNLYKKYCRIKHGREDNDAEAVLDDLHHFYRDIIEFNYYQGDTLIAVGVLDRSVDSISTNYFYYDPDHHKRSLGVFSVLKEIEFGRENHLKYYYLGYWIEHCEKMSYKSSYKPHQLLINGSWQEREK